MTVQQLLLAGLGVLSTVVTLLWRYLAANIHDLKRRVDECEKDRLNIWRTLAQDGKPKGE